MPARRCLEWLRFNLDSCSTYRLSELLEALLALLEMQQKKIFWTILMYISLEKKTIFEVPTPTRGTILISSMPKIFFAGSDMNFWSSMSMAFTYCVKVSFIIIVLQLISDEI